MPDPTGQHGFTRVDQEVNALGLRSWARTALAHGMMSDAEVHRWETLYYEVVAEGSFSWAVSFFITSGRKAILPT